MAIRRKVGNLASTLLQSHLDKRRVEQQYDLQRRNQQELSQQRSQEQLFSKLTSDPAAAERARNSGMEQINGVDTSLFIPTRDQAVSGVGSDSIAKKSKLEDLPTDLDFEPLLKSAPGAGDAPRDPTVIKTLMDQRNAKQGALKSAVPPSLIKEVAPNGQEQTIARNPWEMMEAPPIKTGLSTAEQVSKAGQTAGAQTSATQAAQEPYEIAKDRRAQFDRIELENIKRTEERSKLPPSIVEKVAGADSSMYILDKIVTQYAKPSVSEHVGPLAGRAARARELLPFLEPNDPDYASFSADISTLNNAVIKAVTGAQMSDPEAKRIMSQVPGKYDKEPDFQAKARATRENMIMLRNRIIQLAGSNEPLMEMPPPGGDVQDNRTPAQQKLERIRRGQ